MMRDENCDGNSSAREDDEAEGNVVGHMLGRRDSRVGEVVGGGRMTKRHRGEVGQR